MAIEKQTKQFMELIQKSEEEIVSGINSGLMNSYIEAYAVVAMKEAGFSIKEIKRLDFNSVFDFYGAKEQVFLDLINKSEEEIVKKGEMI